MVVYHITNFFKKTKPILTTFLKNQNQQFHKNVITTQHWYPLINSLWLHGVDLCHNIYEGTKRKLETYIHECIMTIPKKFYTYKGIL
jgi:hypothetical protein